MRLIHIRGGHCSGKTTITRLILGREILSVIRGEKSLLTASHDGKILAIGDYTKKYGLDGCTPSKLMVLESIQHAAKLNPDIILFESVIWGVKQAASLEFNMVAKAEGMPYENYFLYQDLDTTIQRCINRGNKNPNIDRIIKTTLEFESAYAYCMNKGLLCSRINTANRTPESIKEEILHGHFENI